MIESRCCKERDIATRPHHVHEALPQNRRETEVGAVPFFAVPADRVRRVGYDGMVDVGLGLDQIETVAGADFDLAGAVRRSRCRDWAFTAKPTGELSDDTGGLFIDR